MRLKPPLDLDTAFSGRRTFSLHLAKLKISRIKAIMHHMVIAEQLDNRQGKCNGNQSADRSQRHTNDGKHVAFVRIAGHHRGQGAERHIDCGVANSGAQVICHEDVPELETSRSLRHGKQGNRGDDIGESCPKQPRTRTAPTGTGLADNNAHDDIRASVKETGNQHNKTDSNKRDSGIVCIE